MSDTKTIATVSPASELATMRVIARTAEAIYLRLPSVLQRDCGGCSCEHCQRNPELAKWDTLVVPTREGTFFTYTVHMPDGSVQGFQQRMREKLAASLLTERRY